MKSVFGWQPKWNIETAMEKIVEWNKVYLGSGDVAAVTKRQFEEYIES